MANISSSSTQTSTRQHKVCRLLLGMSLLALICVNVCTMAWHAGWLFDLTTHFHPHYAAAALLLIVLAALMRCWSFAVVALACLIFNAVQLWPSYVGRPERSAQPAAVLRLLTANVSTPNRNGEKLLSLITAFDADIVALSETGSAF